MTDTGGTERHTPDFGLIADEDLPEDLQPDQNPLARDPDDDRSEAGPPGDASPDLDAPPDSAPPSTPAG